MPRPEAAPGSRRRPRPAAVAARGWGWQHGGRAGLAVSGLDLAISPGERVLLLGASGAGKSTFLHALAGVLGPDTGGEEQGVLTLDGVHPANARGRTGLVLQDPDSQTVLSRVGDEVAFGAENLAVPAAEIWPRVRSALADVGLEVPLDRSTSALSGGQKQRLALASVMAMEPGLLLLDEPTANLDPDGVVEIRDAVTRVLDRTGATLIVVEHRVDVWAGVVDRVVVLAAGGGVLADGSPEQVLGNPAHRSTLAESGVWLPGIRPEIPGGPWRPAAAGPRLLEARGLAVARSLRGPAVLTGADLSLDAGTAVGITGPNGAGKSTLALTLGGLLRPRGGTLTAAPALAGTARPEPGRWTSAQLVDRIGTVFQEPEHQFLANTVLDELAFGPRRLGRETDGQVLARVHQLAERLRLDGLLEANPFTLSGGEKRRLSVATMLATEPSILLLDEPTFGQDARTWAELVALLRGQLSEGRCVVSVTHDAEFIEALASRNLRVADGVLTPAAAAPGVPASGAGTAGAATAGGGGTARDVQVRR
ncbi:energy-coupling factor ABC transporter ATP-binding protein [Arthrobacter sp. zg-Y826]|uniref:ABC transporter ATP-binding protein n=1 Tax=Arthrobacter jinronghuae TaxID=2964609 RepID=UPI00210338C7|nr:ABC transporter ATP-binding protein [Arthrobacter jinronghuae]MCQ1955547.1 energy-coupling factor ABC transporter ATP-binding protein [Arthrobacter jinronghuae]